MTEAITYLHHRPPITIYGVQMAREELQVIEARKPMGNIDKGKNYPKRSMYTSR